MSDQPEPDADGLVEAAFITLSEIDSGVWVPHIPYAPLAESEGSATTSIRRARKYVQNYLGVTSGYRWVLVEPGVWSLRIRPEAPAPD